MQTHHFAWMNRAFGDIVWTLAICCVIPVTAAVAEPRLQNGGFEQGIAGEAPAHWVKAGWGPAQISLVQTEVYRGRGALKIISNGVSWHYAAQDAAVEPDRTYLLQWYGKTGGVPGSVEVRGYKPDGTLWGQGRIVIADKCFGPARWTSYSQWFTVPAGVRRIAILLGTGSWRRKGTWVLYDEVSLVPVELEPRGEQKAAAATAQINLVLNGGFELGLRDWILHHDRLQRRGFRLDEPNPYEGRFCLSAIEAHPPAVISNWFRARPGHRYFLSLALKGAGAGQKAGLGFYAGSGRSLVRIRWQAAELSPEWQVFTLDAVLPRQARVKKMVVEVSASAPFSVDAVRVTEDAPAGPSLERNEAVGVAVGFDGQMFPNVFDYGSAAQIRLEARNLGGTPRQLTIEYALAGPSGAACQRGRYAVVLKPKRSESTALPLNTARRGRFDWIVRLLDEQGHLIRRTVTPLAVLKPVQSAPTAPLGTNFNGQQYSTATIEENMALLRRYGFVWWRLWFSWKLVQPQPDAGFHWREFDRQVHAAVDEQHLRVMAVLCKMWDWNTWRSRGVASGDLRQWERFVQATVARYKSRIHAWEVLNEWPLQPQPELTRYVEIVKATWAAIKKVDPAGVVVTCSGASGPRRYADIQDFLTAGGGRYSDALGIHPYPEIGAPIAQDLEGTIRRIQQWGRAAGHEQKVWLTEAGNYTSEGGYLGDGDNCGAATNLVQANLIAWKGRTWLCMHAASPGLNSRRSLYDPVMVPNAVTCACNALAEQIHRARRESCRWLSLPKSIGNVCGMQFRRGNDAVVALWSLGEPNPRRLLIPCGDQDVSLTDMMGNPVKLVRRNGSLLVPVRPAVEYVRFPNASPERIERAFQGTEEERAKPNRE